MSEAKQERRWGAFLPPPWIAALLTGGLVLWLAAQIKEILVLLVVAYAIAYVIDPILGALERRKISRGLGVVVISVVLFVGIFLLGVTAVPTIEREYQKLATNLPSYVEVVRGKVGGLVDVLKERIPARFLPTSIDHATTALPGIPTGAIENLVRGAGQALLSGYSLTLTILNLTLLPFLTFYIAVDFGAMHRRALALLPLAARGPVERIGGEIDGYVSAFVRGQFMIGAVLFLLYALGLWIVGVELWLLLALVAGFGNVVPYLGFLVGIVLSSIMALVTFGDFAHLVQVWAVFAVVQGLEGTVITPRILGEKVGLSPLAVILAIVVGGQLFGLLGIFLAVPGAAALRVLGAHLHERLIVGPEGAGQDPPAVPSMAAPPARAEPPGATTP